VKSRLGSYGIVALVKSHLVMYPRQRWVVDDVRRYGEILRVVEQPFDESWYRIVLEIDLCYCQHTSANLK
jgi:hypothetical protein